MAWAGWHGSESVEQTHMEPRGQGRLKVEAQSDPVRREERGGWARLGATGLSGQRKQGSGRFPPGAVLAWAVPASAQLVALSKRLTGSLWPPGVGRQGRCEVPCTGQSEVGEATRKGTVRPPERVSKVEWDQRLAIWDRAEVSGWEAQGEQPCPGWVGGLPSVASPEPAMAYPGDPWPSTGASVVCPW